MVLNDDIHKYDKVERGIDKMLRVIKEAIDNCKTYKKLWEEQNKELDEQKLRLHRKDRQIKRLELKVEKLELEISDLKARKRAKKSK